MLTYIWGYLAFLLGVLLYVLAKVQEFKQMAESNPDPKISYSTKAMFNKEWVNFVRLLIGGIALVILLPMLVGSATLDVKSAAGSVVSTFALKSVLIPLYFFIGYSGNSALFALFGKYKKTLLERVGVDEKP